jgi:DNA polymerase
MHVLIAAHTGRFGGRRVQVHNLPKGVKGVDVPGLLASGPTWEAVSSAAQLHGVGVDDILSTLLRSCFVATPGTLLAICDYAAVEARCVAWLANESTLLAGFRDGTDIYKEMAARIYGVPVAEVTKAQREVGKIVILGCGYGMSDRKLQLFCDSLGINLETANTTALACVEAYRTAFPKIAGFVAGHLDDGRPYRRGGLWQSYQQACFNACMDDSPDTVGRVSFRRIAGHLHISLPSGRSLVYRNARVESRVPAYAKYVSGTVEARPTVVYDDPRHGVSSLYGGKIVENVSQAVCNDLLRDALCDCEAAGLDPAMHVHDEIVCAVPEKSSLELLNRLADIMTTPAVWAIGFPIGVEGHLSPRYAKSAWPGMGSVKR